jgi:SPOR domain/Sel1 repeat
MKNSSIHPQGMWLVLFGSLQILFFLSPRVLADFDSAADTYRNKDYSRAMEEFRPLAEQGDPRAQTVLALMYKYGEGTRRDLASAFAWYSKAAELGYAPAQYHTGNMLAEGIGVDVDVNAAITWLTRSAESGFSRANNKLEELNALKVTLDSPVDEYIPWSQSWDFNLPNRMRFNPDDDSAYSAVTPIPNYRVQLGAMSSKRSAEQLWLQLSSDNPALFAGRSLLVKESMRPDRAIYRVQTGPFDTRDEARSFCANLVNSSEKVIGCLAIQPAP